MHPTNPFENTFRQPVDQVIDARWIVPVEPDGAILHKHSLVIQGDCILDLLPTHEAVFRYSGKRHFSLDEHILLPGLINLHTHAAMTLLRGYADDQPLMRWLKEHIWPAESRHVSTDFVHDGTLLACWEMLRGGITCFNDMYFFPQSAAAASLEAGMRAVLGITVFEFPSAYGTDAQDYLNKGLAIRESLIDEPLISFCLAPHAPYTVADRTFERIATLVEQLDLPIHIHLHETMEEIQGSISEHGLRPLDRLHNLQMLSPHLIAVHAVHLDQDEISLLAAHGCHAAHCPTSNMKLASGIAPICDLENHGVNVGLGTDGAASNNRLDLFQEMRHAALLAKVARHDAAALPAHQALAMATINAARALGMENRIGSLKPGKAADLLAVRLDDWQIQPTYDPISHLVYVSGRESVSHVWVTGRLRIEDKFPVDLDIGALLRRVGIWQNSMSK